MKSAKDLFLEEREETQSYEEFMAYPQRKKAITSTLIVTGKH
jgi:hypothetical protein